mmetsp:Transcript_28543/g.58444  ORF Transcript_28543/g.58444 Transcript_28543/m.58444 type:complete len:207 (+) Transcript_28543:797-1417(+)
MCLTTVPFPDLAPALVPVHRTWAGLGDDENIAVHSAGKPAPELGMSGAEPVRATVLVLARVRAPLPGAAQRCGWPRGWRPSAQSSRCTRMCTRQSTGPAGTCPRAKRWRGQIRRCYPQDAAVGLRFRLRWRWPDHGPWRGRPRRPPPRSAGRRQSLRVIPRGTWCPHHSPLGHAAAGDDVRGTGKWRPARQGRPGRGTPPRSAGHQ